jgi:hypothetical protein
MAKKPNTAEGLSANPDDAIRDAILRYLYEVHKKAKGPQSAAVGIQQLQKALKSTHSYKQYEVGRNLDYLVQKGWVTEVVRERTFKTTGGTIQSAQQVKYKISHIGIDKLQSASLYQRTPMETSVNITNVHGVTVVGEGNVVNTSFTDLSRVLNDLKAAVQANTAIENAEKLNALADIETLQSQLQKPQPNRSVISAVWGGIEKIAAVGGLVDLAMKVKEYIGPLLRAGA